MPKSYTLSNKSFRSKFVLSFNEVRCFVKYAMKNSLYNTFTIMDEEVEFVRQEIFAQYYKRINLRAVICHLINGGRAYKRLGLLTNKPVYSIPLCLIYSLFDDAYGT